MPVEFIPARSGGPLGPVIDSLIAKIRADATELGASNGVIYYGWPQYSDYDAVKHPVDIALLAENIGLVLIRVLATDNEKIIREAAESISQASATAVAQLVRSPLLRNRSRQLKVPVVPAIFAPEYDSGDVDGVETFNSEAAIIRFIDDLGEIALSEEEIEEARSILEGAKALTRPTKRSVSNPERQRAAVALSKLEEEIASFDHKQRQVALTMLRCPQRIRGLAGSGKTVILAMKAALAHLENPESRVLVTFYTRSLRDHLARLISKFYRHFGEGKPNWKRVDIRHGWGRKDLAGVYREACLRAEVIPLSYAQASSEAARGQDPFDYACRKLLETGKVKAYYDLILIDEGQDFPSGFYELCFYLTKGSRDTKQIVWAYDELQNVFNVHVRTPEALFGKDTDGEPRVSLQRALPVNADTNDFVLPKSYRNQRDILVLAHASGFGVYGTPVQMLESKDHWEDVGYEVLTDNMEPGSPVIIHRPDHNSPTRLATPNDLPLVTVRNFRDLREEVGFIADEFKRFIDEGLDPHDLMAIAIDDKAAQLYLSALAEELSERGIDSNNIIADRYNEPSFTIEGKCTLSTVYKAKGNEAAVVAVLGCDAVPLDTRSGRNRLFTAFTRTKGWLRITGMGLNFRPLQQEIDKALELAPDMKFVMPDPAKIAQIQRDLSDRDARMQRAREEMDRLQESLSLSDDEFRAILAEKSKDGRA
jgi:superfamily I DNA and RNA helicase